MTTNKKVVKRPPRLKKTKKGRYVKVGDKLVRINSDLTNKQLIKVIINNFETKKKRTRGRPRPQKSQQDFLVGMLNNRVSQIAEKIGQVGNNGKIDSAKELVAIKDLVNNLKLKNAKDKKDIDAQIQNLITALKQPIIVQQGKPTPTPPSNLTQPSTPPPVPARPTNNLFNTPQPVRPQPQPTQQQQPIRPQPQPQPTQQQPTQPTLPQQPKSSSSMSNLFSRSKTQKVKVKKTDAELADKVADRIRKNPKSKGFENVSEFKKRLNIDDDKAFEDLHQFQPIILRGLQTGHFNRKDLEDFANKKKQPKKFFDTVRQTPLKEIPQSSSDDDDDDDSKAGLEDDNEQSGQGKGKGGLYDWQIEKIMKPYKEEGWQGVVAADEINQLKPQPKMSWIMNLSKRGDKDGGSHWVAVYLDAESGGDYTLEYYDSTGEEPSDSFRKQVKDLVDKIDPDLMLKFKINKIREQSLSKLSTNCGYLAMSFLMKRYAGYPFKECSVQNDVKRAQERVKKLEANLKKRFDFI